HIPPQQSTLFTYTTLFRSGSGKEQNMTISGSTKMSDDEIKQKVDEAERFAEEDKKRKEAIEAKNNAESIIYQTEKTIADLGDKVTQDEKAPVEEKIEELKKALESDNIEDIKTKTDDLTQSLYKMSEKLYSQPGEAAGSENADDDVVDADYEVVDEEEDK